MSKTVETLLEDNAEIRRMLRSLPGKKLMARLKDEWDSDDLIHSDPQVTAYNVGKRDSYRTLERLAEDPIDV